MHNGDRDDDMGQDITENEDESSDTEQRSAPQAKREQQDAPQAKREQQDAPQGKREQQDAPQGRREQQDAPQGKREEYSAPQVTQVVRSEKEQGSQSDRERYVPNNRDRYSEEPNSGRGNVSTETQSYRPPSINLGEKSATNMFLPSSINNTAPHPSHAPHPPTQSGAVSPSTLPPPLTTVSPVSSKFDSIKAWSVNKIVCTRQMLSERLGRGSKTIDADLEIQIEDLRDTQRKYEEMHRQARALTSNFGTVVTSQRALADTFRELAQKIPELNEQFEINADSHKLICRKGEVLLNDLNFFTSSISTLCGKTIEDTLLTVKQYESARIEYDAYRTDLEADLRIPSKAEEAQRQFDLRKEKFEGLRDDVAMKIKLLNGNKVKVMHKQLLLLHNAVTAYFTDNQSTLTDSQQKFKDIKPRTPDVDITGDDI